MRSCILTLGAGYGCDSEYRYGEVYRERAILAEKCLGNIYHLLSLNRYLYREDDPVNAVDPSGRRAYESLEVGGGLIGGLGILVGLVNPSAGLVIGVVGAVVGTIGLGLHFGELISDWLFPIDESLSPAPLPRNPGGLLPPWHDPYNPYAPCPVY